MAAENPTFTSVLASHLEGFLRERQAGGYDLHNPRVYLRDFDRWISQHPCPPNAMPRATVEAWTAKRPNESGNTHFGRVCLLRQFARYLTRQGLSAYICPPRTGIIDKYGFVPRIFSRAEVQQIFHEVDHWPRVKQRPVRHLVLPEVFRVLYGCGLRVGEVMSLRVRDVDLEEGVLAIREAKLDRERLVPLAPSLQARLQRYAEARGVRPAEEPFFGDERGKPLTHAVIYCMFREILWRMKIPYVGGGHGPRPHDLRHTFAVHRLVQWYQQGVDLAAMLPLLSTYMGHTGMVGTQRYLPLVADLFPAITEKLEQLVGQVIPEGDLP